jgi:hypothetical protein
MIDYDQYSWWPESVVCLVNCPICGSTNNIKLRSGIGGNNINCPKCFGSIVVYIKVEAQITAYRSAEGI